MLVICGTWSTLQCLPGERQRSVGWPRCRHST